MSANRNTETKPECIADLPAIFQVESADRDGLMRGFLETFDEMMAGIEEKIDPILKSLKQQINQLSADPFDDLLLEDFQDYLQNCREDIKQAQLTFRSLPNPPSLARTAAHLYYCLNQINDGLNELEYFPLSYDESYLHAGLEMFRIAHHLYREAQESVQLYK